ncbi:MAG: hypothetical protein WCR52_23195 [Bacteroidota bacterium]
MNKIFSAALILCSIGIFFSCNNNQNNLKVLQKQTEDMHDEAMKDLGGMNRISRNLQKELAHIDSLHQTSPRRDSILETIRIMHKAEDDMMAWMAQYQAADQLPAKEALDYMTKQKNDIEKNRNDIKEAMQRGKALAR